jgi:hypothetical protein
MKFERVEEYFYVPITIPMYSFNDDSIRECRNTSHRFP